MRSLSRIFRKQVNRIRRVGFVIVNLLDIRRVLGAFFLEREEEGRKEERKKEEANFCFYAMGPYNMGASFSLFGICMFTEAAACFHHNGCS